MPTLPKRLKEARTRAGLSQEQLGIRIGIDPASASTRMNRYEVGKRIPDPDLVERIAMELELPASYFYAVDDTEALILEKLHKLDSAQKKSLLLTLEGFF